MNKLQKAVNIIITLIVIGLVVDLWRGSLILNKLIDSYESFVFIMAIIGGLLFLYGIILSRRLKKLSEKSVSFDEEDKINEKIDKMYADVTLFHSISMTIFLFLVATGFIILRDTYPGLILIVFGLLVAAFLANLNTYYLAKEIYPERNYPETDDEQFQEKLFEVMDDGEKFITLQAYYKVFQIINPLLAAVIMLASIYSAFTGESQIFSIVFMTIMLIVINTTYILTIRDK
ncbi:MAG TPA: DUF3169 family protein [Candidatus Avamphibacillus sp.]|nr:DUF3169 family protein [Candidatus Avamphibacillus sp.]